jgi:hypothetical protein
MRRFIGALLAVAAAVTITAVTTGPASAQGVDSGPILCCR